MAEEEKQASKGGSFITKYLIIGIIVLINILLVAGVSIFVYNTMKSGPVSNEETLSSTETVKNKERALFDINNEFRIPTRDGGMVIFKLALGLSTEGSRLTAEKNYTKVYDAINTFFLKKDTEGVKDDFINTGNKRLHSQLARAINEALKDDFTLETFYFKDDIKQEVVNVYFKSFLTTKN
jgi:flagellar basal body-associated protein FliL